MVAPSTTDVIDDEAGLSTYERQRLVKIARNQARLESLGLATNTPLRRARRQTSCCKHTTSRQRNATTATMSVHQRGGRSSARLKQNQHAAPAQHQQEVLVAAAELGTANDGRNQQSYEEHKGKKQKQNHRRATTSTATLRLPTSTTAEALTVDDLRTYERDAFVALREWKRARGRELGYSNPCVICHNRTLVELCRYVPDDEETLLRVWGISLPRLAQHGELMLEALGPWRKVLRAGHAQHNNHL